MIPSHAIAEIFSQHPWLPLPHSIEAEQALLGAILTNGDALDAVGAIVTADDFFEPINRLLFEQFARARNEGRHINLQLAIALLSENVKHIDIAGLNVKEYVARLAAEAVTVINAPDFARHSRTCRQAKTNRDCRDSD